MPTGRDWAISSPRCRPLPDRLVLHLGLEIARGLGAVRDFPGLLSAVDLLESRVLLYGDHLADFRVKLSDFGIRGEPQPQSTTGVVKSRLGDLANFMVLASTEGDQDVPGAGAARQLNRLSDPLRLLFGALLESRSPHHPQESGAVRGIVRRVQDCRGGGRRRRGARC